MAVDIPRRGLMLVLSSPSGAGKTTLARRLLERDDNLEMSVSVTTRPARPGEIEGRDYVFVDQLRFAEMVGEQAFLEHAVVFSYHYGTPKAQVEAALAAGRDVLFDVDWQGTQQLVQSAPRDIVSIFILPPSIDELRRRLHARAQDSDEVVASRMARAADELSHWAEYEYTVVNEDVDRSLEGVHAILKGERLKRQRRTGLGDFVAALRERA